METNMFAQMETYSTRLSPQTVSFLMKRGEIMKVQPGNIIAQEGERSDHVYIVIHGTAAVEKSDSLGNRTEIAQVESGSLIGEMGVFLDMKRSATIAAKTEMTLLKFTCENFINALPQTPDLTVRLLKTLADKVNDVNRKFSNAMVQNTIFIVGLFILDMLDTYSTRYESIILNTRELADTTELDRNKIMTALNSLLKHKIITQWTYIDTDNLSFKAHIPELKTYLKEVASKKTSDAPA